MESFLDLAGLIGMVFIKPFEWFMQILGSDDGELLLFYVSMLCLAGVFRFILLPLVHGDSNGQKGDD